MVTCTMFTDAGVSVVCCIHEVGTKQAASLEIITVLCSNSSLHMNELCITNPEYQSHCTHVLLYLL